ncbi:hypothetical protein, partial [Pseudoflavonifractor sp. 60]|uniref:hypothetical protein n=1 Tax=Pseudoflavonifractor sp. 60 TaxID=2304576 RepID=UPI001A9BB565
SQSFSVSKLSLPGGRVRLIECCQSEEKFLFCFTKKRERPLQSFSKPRLSLPGGRVRLIECCQSEVKVSFLLYKEKGAPSSKFFRVQALVTGRQGSAD